MLPNIQIVHSEIISNYWKVHEGNSINMTVDFRTYNAKIAPRMRAQNLFLEIKGHELSDKNKAALLLLIKIEELRLKGNFLGILFSNGPFIEKLRSISMSNNFFYIARSYLFGFFSGW
jgi:hypothetical protein